jgi:hypothetical protein
MDADLLAAYARTEYHVDDHGYAFILRVDEPSAPLRACHAAFGVNCSTFITAWNPRSEPTPQHENEVAMARLHRELAAMGLRWLRGEGIDPSGDWPGEPSLLVLGLDETAARELAGRFGQNALLCADAGAAPRLVICT